MSKLFPTTKTTHSKPAPVLGTSRGTLPTPVVQNVPKMSLPVQGGCRTCPGAMRRK